MSLNDTKIRSLKPSEKPFKVSDSHGLYLLVNPNGSRLWYLKYRINKKESRLGLGAYPDVSLAVTGSGISTYFRTPGAPSTS
ncbi:integrase [Yersinia intermedia]|nr:integrase [Yersinia intermedia]CQD74773.1 integrase [Yersinia intermedia]